jgi:hypothetical protein
MYGWRCGALNRVHRGHKVPSPAFACDRCSPRPLQATDFVKISGRFGLSVILPFDDCFSPLVEGAHYEVVVHWKTTPPKGMAVPAELLVEELVSEPFTYTHLGLEKRRTPEGALKHAGLDGFRVRAFLEEVRRRAIAKDWPGVCALTSLPLRVNDATLASGFRDTTVETQAGCERLMPRVFDRRLMTALTEEDFVSSQMQDLVEREPGELSLAGGRLRIAGVCGSMQGPCDSKTLKIVYVMAFGGP